MKKTITIVLTIVMLFSFLIAGVTLGVGVLDEPYNEPTDESSYEPVATAEAFTEIDAETATETMSNGHILDLSSLPPSGGVWNIDDGVIEYSGGGPLTISGSNTVPYAIVVTSATRVNIEDNTTINGTLRVPTNTTIHGFGGGISIINTSVFGDVSGIWDGLSLMGIYSEGNVTISGIMGDITVNTEMLYAPLLAGIYVLGNLSILGSLGDVTAIAETVTSGDSIRGIHSEGNLLISGAVGNINANGIDTGLGDAKIGMGIASSSNITISGTIGNITAGMDGISTSWGNDNNINIGATGRVGDISAGQSGLSAFNPYGYGMASITIDGVVGNVIGTGRQLGDDFLGGLGTFPGSIGISGISASHGLTINGTVGNITNFLGGINGGGITISGSVGNIIGTDSSQRGLSATHNVVISGVVGVISNFQDAISSGGGDITLSGSFGNISARSVGLNVSESLQHEGNININSPITVIGARSSFSKQPIIGIPHTAAWSNNVDGSVATDGSPYKWSAEHRWVRVDRADGNGNGNGTDPGNGGTPDTNETELTDNDDDTGMGLVAPPGTVPPDTRLQVTPVAEGGNFTIINNALAQTSNKWVAFDIKLISDSFGEIQPNGNVTISIPREMWQGFNHNKMAVFHISPEGEYTLIPPWPVRMDSTQDNLIFEWNRFSLFAIAELTDEAIASLLGGGDDGTAVLAAHNIPQTGDSANALLWVSLLSVSALGIVLVMVWHRKRVHNK